MQLEFHCRAAGNRLLYAQRQSSGRRNRILVLAGIRRVVKFAHRHAVGLFRIFRYNQLIDENTRNHNFFCRKCALADDILHLAEHNSAARLCCHRNRLNVGQYRLILTGQVSILISGCTANECNINLRGLIRQIFRSTNLHNLDQFLFGDGVALTAFHARIDEGTDTDSTQLNIQSLGTATEHMLDDALREVVALHLQILLHLHDGMVRAVMTDDYALNHPNAP